MTEETPRTPQVLDPRWLEPARRVKATVCVSVAILPALLLAFLSPDSMPQNQAAFGSLAAKFGLPLRAVVTLIDCGVYLPIPFAFWHLFRLLFRGAAEGESISVFGIVRAILYVPSRHHDLRRSRLIVLLIVGGYGLAIFTYAYLADERDLKRKRSEPQDQQGAYR